VLQLGHGIFSVETSSYFVSAALGKPRFNWATEFSPWKLARSERAMTRQIRFNWATEFSPWKLIKNYAVGSAAFVLQLGHGIFSVETHQCAERNVDPKQASIGPRNFLRGNINSSIF